MKRLPTLILYCLFATPMFAQDDVTTAKWAPKMVADGVNNEWPRPLNLYESSTGLLFSIANDSSNLFLCFTTNSINKARKLMQAGWSISILSKEKSGKVAASLTFAPVATLPPVNDAQPALGTNHKRLDGFSEFVNHYKSTLTVVTANGFLTTYGNLPIGKTAPFAIGLGQDSTEGIIYEISIPLKEISATGQLPDDVQFNLQVNVNGLKGAVANSSANMGGRRDRMTDGRNGTGGRQRIMENENPADEMATSQLERMALGQKASFKQKFKLTMQPSK